MFTSTAAFFTLALATLSGFDQVPVVDVTIGDLIRSPEAFNGKLVKTHGLVTSGDEEFGISDDGKGVDVWLQWADDSRVEPRPSFSLQSDNELKRLKDYLRKNRCRQLSATITGRFDYVKPERIYENGRLVHIIGFGHLNLYGKRLVAKSVGDVVCKEY